MRRHGGPGLIGVPEIDFGGQHSGADLDAGGTDEVRGAPCNRTRCLQGSERIAAEPDAGSTIIEATEPLPMAGPFDEYGPLRQGVTVISPTDTVLLKAFQK
jgi:hypothetical protein